MSQKRAWQATDLAPATHGGGLLGQLLLQTPLVEQIIVVRAQIRFKVILSPDGLE
jgi:hypothetical protein